MAPDLVRAALEQETPTGEQQAAPRKTKPMEKALQEHWTNGLRDV